MYILFRYGIEPANLRLIDGLIAFSMVTAITYLVPFTILFVHRNLFGPIYDEAIVIGLNVLRVFGGISTLMTLIGWNILC